MAEQVKTWKCQRRVGGVVCGQVNVKPKRKCSACGGLKRKKRRPKHAAVLDTRPYAEWVAEFGARCGICGWTPTATSHHQRLQRDHDHAPGPTYGQARGLLCFQCNIMLKRRHTLDWMRRAVAYLERAEQRGAGLS